MREISAVFSREPELQEVLRMVTRDQVGAVLLASSPGMGVTALLEEIRKQLSLVRPVVILRGVSSMRSLNYGAFVTLGGPDPTQALSADPGPAVGVLHHCFGSQAEQLGPDYNPLTAPPVVLIDDADHLDEASTNLLATLVMNGDVLLIASRAAEKPLPGALRELWEAGLAEELEVSALSRDRTAALAEQILQAPLLPGLDWRLWQDSGGNPLVVALLLEEAINTGAIVKRRTVWVAGQRAPWMGEGLQTVLEARLQGMSPRVRAALDALALGGALRESSIEATFGEDTIDQLMASGLVVMSIAGEVTASSFVPQSGAEPAAELRIANRIYARMLRELVPVGLRRSLLDGLTDLSSDPDSASGLLLRTVWSVDAGVEVEPETLLRAATVASRHFSESEASRLLEQVPEGFRPAWVQSLKARIAFNQGDYASALELLTVPGSDSDPEFALRSSLLAAGTTTALGYSGQSLRASAARLLALAAEQGPAVVSYDGEADVRVALTRRAHVLQAMSAAQEGRLEAMDALVSETVKGTAGLANTAALVDRSVALALSSESLLARGQADAAVDRVMEAFSIEHDESADVYFLPEMVLLRVLLVLIVSGNSEEALALADRLPLDSTEASAAFGGGSSLVAGLISLLRGEPEASLEGLLAAQENLRLHDPQRLRGLVGSLACLAAALTGQLELAEELRRDYDPSGSLLYSNTMTPVVMDFAGILLGDPGEGLSRMKRVVDSLVAGEQFGSAASVLSLIDNAGDHSIRGVMKEVVGQMTGPWARAQRMFLEAADSPDPRFSLEAGQTLAAEGNPHLGQRLLVGAVTKALAAGDGIVAHQARESLSALGGAAVDEEVRKVVAGPRLTRREDEIVRLAREGMSDDDIARTLHLSVRTVGGHLTRAYRKLGVSSRRQLADVYKG